MKVPFFSTVMVTTWEEDGGESVSEASLVPWGPSAVAVAVLVTLPASMSSWSMCSWRCRSV